MKIIYNRHKTKSIFPLTIEWIESSTNKNTGSRFGYTITVKQFRSVKDEEEMWEEKYDIETGNTFLYWVTDWDEIEDILDDAT